MHKAYRKEMIHEQGMLNGQKKQKQTLPLLKAVTILDIQVFLVFSLLI